MGEGYIKLSREFFADEVWAIRRRFSDWEAWLDMVQLARFEESPISTVIEGNEVMYGHAQYPTSNRSLAKRWRWNGKRVNLFLVRLEESGIISVEKLKRVRIITICEYDNLVLADNL